MIKRLSKEHLYRIPKINIELITTSENQDGVGQKSHKSGTYTEEIIYEKDRHEFSID